MLYQVHLTMRGISIHNSRRVYDGSFDFPSTGIVVFTLSQFDREIMLWFAFRVIFHTISEFYLIQQYVHTRPSLNTQMLSEQSCLHSVKCLWCRNCIACTTLSNIPQLSIGLSLQTQMNSDNVVWSKSKTWFLIIILPSSISLLNPEIYVYCQLVFGGPLFLFASVQSLFLFELRLLITPFLAHLAIGHVSFCHG